VMTSFSAAKLTTESPARVGVVVKHDLQMPPMTNGPQGGLAGSRIRVLTAGPGPWLAACKVCTALHHCRRV
jgi:hypothetical protein